jgi:hypothetical protein
VTPAQGLFGTDFPPGGASRDVAQRLADTRMFDANAALRDGPRERGEAAAALQSLDVVVLLGFGATLPRMSTFWSRRC